MVFRYDDMMQVALFFVKKKNEEEGNRRCTLWVKYKRRVFAFSERERE